MQNILFQNNSIGGIEMTQDIMNVCLQISDDAYNNHRNGDVFKFGSLDDWEQIATRTGTTNGFYGAAFRVKGTGAFLA